MNLDYPEEILLSVQKPSRYLGEEPFYPLKDWKEVSLRVCLGYPDLYEVGRSHLGINILASIVNSREKYLCDLIFAVAPDFERELKKSGVPLLSLNYRKPIREFEVLGLSYAYELLSTTIMQILDLGGIPIKAEERSVDDPIVLGGGPCMGNPEPIAPCFDALILGDAEEALLEVLEVIEEWQRQKDSRNTLYQELIKIEGVYVPLFKNRTRKRFFLFDRAKSYQLFGVPVAPLSHDRVSLEISRGCTRSCRFCEAGFYYRPVREKSPERIVKEVREAFNLTGYREASLMSLSMGDYTALEALIRLLRKEFYSHSRREFIFSIPSLRVGRLTPEILDFLKEGRVSTITMAVEAASERLRKVINKLIDMEMLFEELELAQRKGFKRVKLYFMLGLPTEDEEDLKEMVKLYRRLKGRFKNMEITFSASIFVPKPNTPFQWERQITVEEAMDKIRFLKSHLGRAFKYHNPHQSYIEGVISRGGRELFSWISLSYERGARLDSWEDYFMFVPWKDSAVTLNIDTDSYLRERDLTAILPWDHLDFGISREFLIRERERAYNFEYTLDCRWSSCHRCGICDKDIKNILLKDEKTPIEISVKSISPAKGVEHGEWWYRISFDKRDKAKFLSQLELQRLFEMILRRRGFSLSYSQGYNPRPRFLMGPATSVGIEVFDEFLFVAFTERIKEEELRDLSLYRGLVIRDVKFVGEKKPSLPQRMPYYLLYPRREVGVLRGSEEFTVIKSDGYYTLKPLRIEASPLRYLRELEGIDEPLQVFRIIKKYHHDFWTWI
ncbi:MAG: TIGR03936 family radical SAM-associated protein [Caldimicrobium sp.]|nr:TIGR03936 family radical SAM-associated protein [Caldimicrobium sp.]MCX7613765.1 TIGR03936 family radical SAM-associated protein [Caldimicrobium sp.]MDW8182592.1 TIGR03936 family radical SAM-associated protein [Caldimicrobium sp.]